MLSINLYFKLLYFIFLSKYIYYAVFQIVMNRVLFNTFVSLFKKLHHIMNLLFKNVVKRAIFLLLIFCPLILFAQINPDLSGGNIVIDGTGYKVGSAAKVTAPASQS